MGIWLGLIEDLKNATIINFVLYLDSHFHCVNLEVGYCLKCKHSKELRKIAGGVIVECSAPNRCMMSEFNANDFYCVEYKGANDMTQAEKDSIAQAVRNEYLKLEFRKYANKYYPKKQRCSDVCDLRILRQRGMW